MTDLNGFLQNYYMELSLVYVAVLSVLSFVLFAVDKVKAKLGRWRIPERVLLLCAGLGGSFGAFAAIRLLHHKSNCRRHPQFAIGVPVMVAAHTALLIWLFLQR